MTATGDRPMELIVFDSFDTAAAVDPSQREQATRRFRTLLVDASAEGGPSRGRVRQAQNTEGDTFAIKSLFPLVGAGAGISEGTNDAALRALSSAFFESYRNLLLVSGLRGFPQVFGYGTVAGVPAMLMEWVEGLSLMEATPLLPHAGEGQGGARGVKGTVVAAMGEAVAGVLSQTRHLDAGFAHRDISPRNIMIRTSSRSIEEQVASGSFDVCLVDLGSSSVTRAEDPTFTMRSHVWRAGTPEYAAPEMLTNDVAKAEGLRQSPSVDVYALCSVLYELYAGRTPFDVASQPLRSPYQIKTEGRPAKLEPHDGADAALVDAIMAGIKPRPEDREDMDELLARIRAWRAGEHYRGLSRPVTRRAAIGLGVAAVLGIGAAAIVTRGFGLLRARELDSYGWDELAELAERIAAAGSDEEGLAIAQRAGLVNADGRLTDEHVKRFALADGTPAEAQLVGLRADARSDGQGVAGLSFLMRTPVAQRTMNDEAQDGGWEQSSLRAWMADELPGLLPGELVSRVIAVDKLTNNVGATRDASAITTTSDAFWVPSMSELCGYQGPETFSEEFSYLSALYSGEGSQYQLFYELGISGLTANERLVRTVDGQPIYWWERTPSADGSEGAASTAFNRVMADGDAFDGATPGDAPAEETYVLPGFCL